MVVFIMGASHTGKTVLAQCQKFSQSDRWIDEAYNFTDDIVREFRKRSNENERRLSGSSSI